MSDKKPHITAIHPAGKDHQVLTVTGGARKVYRREPCPQCPWRVDAVGVFPAEAFKHSACTARDMSTHTFACHDAGTTRPATCAGFLLRGAAHNLSVRMALMTGEIKHDVSDGGHLLHGSYTEMAVANGVPGNDPALTGCRSNHD